MLPGASVTVRVRRPAAGRVTGTNRLRRPRQGDQGAAGGRPAMIGSASQCPGTAPSSPLGRAQTGGWRPGIRLLAPGLGLLRPVGSAGVRRVRPVRRAPSTRNWAPRAAGALDAPGPLGGSARDRCACSHHRGSRTADGRRSALGPAPIPRAGRRPARAGPDRRPACGSWGGPTAPGPRPAPPRDGRPRPTPAPRRISPDTVCRHRPIRRAMRAAQVPLRQARGDHGPRQRPPGAGPDRRPRGTRASGPR